MQDVVVIGGGPGGLHAALQLNSQGFSVTVLEEHATSGIPVHCTGVLGAEVAGEFDIPQEAILNELQTVQFFSPAGRILGFTPDRIEAVVVDRAVFDGRLLDRAVAAGVDVRSGLRAESIETEPDRILIRHTAGHTVARCAILACGANYRLQRKLGLGLPKAHLQSAQAELPAGSPGHVEMHLGSHVAPKGFGWAVPLRREAGMFARIGLMCDRQAQIHFDRLLERVAPRWKIDAAGSRPRLRLLPLAPIDRTFADRLVVIGDAAGIVKASTGGGIYYSLITGSLAAKVLGEGLRRGDLSERWTSRYESLWKERLGEELDAQFRFRTVTDALSDEQIEEIIELAQSDGIIPLVRATARFNQHRDFIWALLRYPKARRILIRHAIA